MVEASADVYKSKIAEVKALADHIPVAVRTFSVETESGPAVFSVSVEKTGKAKMQGFLADGTKISVSSIGALGESYFAVPVVLSKKTLSFGLVFWIPLKGGAPIVANFSRASWRAAQAGVEIGKIVLSDGTHVFDCEIPTFRSYLPTVGGIPVAPVGEEFTVSGSKWIFAKTVGKLKIVDGVLSIVAKSAPANLSGLKLTYTAKTGLVKGSFKLYYMEGGKIKSDKVTITGAVVDGCFIGSGTIKKLGSFAVAAE
jgi:hypothetical protein